MQTPGSNKCRSGDAHADTKRILREIIKAPTSSFNIKVAFNLNKIPDIRSGLSFLLKIGKYAKIPIGLRKSVRQIKIKIINLFSEVVQSEIQSQLTPGDIDFEEIRNQHVG